MKKIMQKEESKGLLAILIYVIFYFFNIQSLPFLILNIDTAKLPQIVRIIYSLFYQFLLIALIGYVLKDKIRKDLDDLKKNHQSYFHKYFKYWFLVLGLMAVSNLSINFLSERLGYGTSISGNEEQINELFEIAPIYTFISAVFIAPILEELVFRQGIRQIFQTNWLFILISGLAFGSMHVFGNVENWIDLLYIIPYSIPGFIFAYVLTKSDNIFTTMGLHFVHNGVLMSLQFLVYLLS